MKIVVFAGGVGTRLWPLSRKRTPKQFGKIIGEYSTLQETIARLLPRFKPSDLYVATGAGYENIVREQLPQIPHNNFILEPEMRDVGPAIGLVASLLERKFPNDPIAILWSDHLVKKTANFINAILLAEEIITKKRGDFVFIAQKPRFANQNMGWIEIGPRISNKERDTLIYHFRQLKYRPNLEEAQAFFHNQNFVWNLGYFVTTPKHLLSLFKLYLPSMCEQLTKIKNAWGKSMFNKTLNRIYPLLEKISFDDAILSKLNPQGVYVISADLGWSDVGAWESLKEALSKTEDENVTKGKVMLVSSRDCLIFNYKNQMVVGIDLDEMLVVNTDDVLLVCPKTSVPKIKKLVEGLAGTPNEHLT